MSDRAGSPATSVKQKIVIFLLHLPMNSTSQHRESPEDSYQKFVASTVSKGSFSTLLQRFFGRSNLNNVTASITIAQFSKSPNSCTQIKIHHVGEEAGLEDLLTTGENLRQLCIVENATPRVLALLGRYWKVDPRFYHDYLENAEWYRLGEIEDHLPALLSVQGQSNHIHFRFIGPREVHCDDPNERCPRLPDPLEQDLERVIDPQLARIAGVLHPLSREGKSFAPVIMTRQKAAAWFDAGVGKSWLKGEKSLT